MTWDILNIIGTMAFAISGAIVALEEEYDLFGVYLLGFVTAFGGGIIRNVLLGLPISDIWNQNMLFTVAFITMTLLFFIPFHWILGFKRLWGVFFDAIGLASFAVQGALFAVMAGYPLSAIIVAGALTGTGGGVVRDMLAGRKPLVLHQEIYAMWAVLGAMTIGFGIADSMWQFILLIVGIVALRMLSVIYQWSLPTRLDWFIQLRKLKR
ncbi:trimeric intracellular cation channel family protein [Filobacillus milosensis]|uniref:Trimeric intracellular cation channel family protein n=1 Tax=Filobacillus milosensis TaxID=94137 RepID=A0A4Y8IPS3_9BACI|nr:trimeric intracellular cation channel family protein [Filobacillus milosensis]TFB21781.1 trimeric intracellular cation channel family protein [Filobacillus milosensis]